MRKEPLRALLRASSAPFVRRLLVKAIRDNDKGQVNATTSVKCPFTLGLSLILVSEYK